MKKAYINGNIITMENTSESTTAILIEDDLIINVGSNEEILNNESIDETIDLDGKTMLPGFIDGHSHFAQNAQAMMTVDIRYNDSKDYSIEYILNKIKQESNPDSKFYYARGFDNNFFKEQRQITKEDLDTISTEKPVIVVHASVHGAVVNSKALEVCNIDATTPQPDDGEIVIDKKTNKPTGELKEMALFLVDQFLNSSLDTDVLKPMILQGQEKYISAGITTAHEGFAIENDLTFYQYANAHNLLDIDIYAYTPLKNLEKWEQAGYILGKKVGAVTLSGVKFFLDGSPQLRTAWVSKPYIKLKSDDEETYGMSNYKDEDLSRGFEYCVQNGIQFIAHTNGDEASEQMIRCYKNVKDQAITEMRPVMVHSQFTRADQLEEMKRISLYPSFFVSHVYYWGDIHIKNFGIERASLISNAKKAIDLDLNFTLHDDSPVVEPNVLFSIWCAVNRKTKSKLVLGDDLKISVLEALKAYTVNAAFQYFAEDRIGSIAKGKVADLVIIDKNILDVDIDEIKNIRVLETIKRGQTIYKNSEVKNE